MIIAIVVLYILGWLTMASFLIIDKEYLPNMLIVKKIKKVILNTFFIWWLSPFAVLGGLLYEHIKTIKDNK